MTNVRIYERDTDAIFLRALREQPRFAERFARLAGVSDASGRPRVRGQVRHVRHTGTIDLDVHYPGGPRFLIENKIDAGYSVTRLGQGQPERYQASTRALRAQGVNAVSVLLAPETYLAGTRQAASFDVAISYEALLDLFSGTDRQIVEAAIQQSAAPYEPEANASTVGFFTAYRRFVAERFSDLTMKRDPNANDVRPTASRTVYFEVRQTLQTHPGVPQPRMSLQCWDSRARSASVKIMIGDWGRSAGVLDAPGSLADIGAYLRPAGRSLGIVVDTPRLETQSPFNDQIEAVVEGLEAALRLQKWWRENGALLKTWTRIVTSSRDARC